MHPPDIAAAAQEEEEVEFSIPLEEIVSLVAAVATAAASSEFVRKHVKPEQYAQMKAKEAQKKEALAERNGADAAVRALLGTPVDKVDIEAGKGVINDAEDAKVMPSLVQKALEHVQKAINVQMMGEGEGKQAELMV